MDIPPFSSRMIKLCPLRSATTRCMTLAETTTQLARHTSFVISICSTHKGIRKETDEMDITDASSDEFSTPAETVGDGSKEESNVVNSLHDVETIDSVEMDITDEGPNAMNSLQVPEVADIVDSAPTDEVELSSTKTLPSHLIRTAAEGFATLRLEADHEPIAEEVKLVKEARSMTAPSLVKHIPSSIDFDASANFATSQGRLRRNGFILSDKLLDIDFEAIDGLRYVQTSFEATAMTDMRRLALQRAQALYDREEARSVAATRQKDDAGTSSPAEVHTSSASYIAARPRMSSTKTATISRTPLPRRRLINPRAKTALRYARAILRTIERRYVILEPSTEGSQVADRATYPPEDRVAPVLLFSKKAMKWKESWIDASCLRNVTLASEVLGLTGRRTRPLCVLDASSMVRARWLPDSTKRRASRLLCAASASPRRTYSAGRRRREILDLSVALSSPTKEHQVGCW
ncbi:hypothetical protein DFH11DRAFT_464584 [Phellopilus nigrolimitatus]|nr:hypothetical protein DFH11DRAFT_464584 [Phellopilus nigrolimitatus]